MSLLVDFVFSCNDFYCNERGPQTRTTLHSFDITEKVENIFKHCVLYVVLSNIFLFASSFFLVQRASSPNNKMNFKNICDHTFYYYNMLCLEGK